MGYAKTSCKWDEEILKKEIRSRKQRKKEERREKKEEEQRSERPGKRGSNRILREPPEYKKNIYIYI